MKKMAAPLSGLPLLELMAGQFFVHSHCTGSFQPMFTEMRSCDSEDTYAMSRLSEETEDGRKKTCLLRGGRTRLAVVIHENVRACRSETNKTIENSPREHESTSRLTLLAQGDRARNVA